MNYEQRMAGYICHTRFDDLPDTAIATIRKMLLTDTGTIIGGYLPTIDFTMAAAPGKT